jgi:hypothetical protein
MNTDRRRLLGVLAGAAAGGVGASAYARTSRADAGATFAASDVTVRTHDGALGAVTVAPAGTVSWSGLEEPAGSAALALYAKLSSDRRFHELDGQRLDAAGLHGETGYQFETRNLLGGPGLAAADFEPGDGETLTRVVRLRLEVTVYASDDETVLTSGDADATFDVTVENRPEDGSVDGEANTGGKPENGDETTRTETTTEDDSGNGGNGNGGDGNRGGGNGNGSNGNRGNGSENGSDRNRGGGNGGNNSSDDAGDDTTESNENNTEENDNRGKKNSYMWKENENDGSGGIGSTGTASGG